jgi:hypothetical protein
MLIRKQPLNLPVYICIHVFDDSRPIGYVHVHRDDGSLTIQCACDDHDFSNPDSARGVELGHLVARDPSLSQLPDLAPRAWAIMQTPESYWQIFAND